MVNSQYLSESTIIQIRQAFHKNKELPSITLQRFFSDSEYKTLSKAAAKASFKRHIDKMRHSFGVAKLPKELKNALGDATLKTYLSVILGREVHRIEGELCAFQWKDYTLLHDEKIEKPGIDLIIDFTEEWDENAGGKIVYVDGTGDSRNVPPSSNTLSITFRKEGVSKFVQYCNHHAGREKRILFLGSVE